MVCLRGRPGQPHPSGLLDQPGVQLYTGNYVHEDNVDHSKAGGRYPEYGAFCLETQHHPCSPNYPQFPSAVLRPGEKYCQSTAYRFTVK